MIPYIFVREGFFYPIEYANDESAKVGALQNPGTKIVFNPLTNVTVWNDGDPGNKATLAVLKGHNNAFTLNRKDG